MVVTIEVCPFTDVYLISALILLHLSINCLASYGLATSVDDDRILTERSYRSLSYDVEVIAKARGLCTHNSVRYVWVIGIIMLNLPT